MSTAVRPTARRPVGPPAPAAPAPATRPAGGWLVGPWFDLLLVANVGWPLVALALFAGPAPVSDSLTFLQVYFLSTPHRWITLVLVFGDPARFRAEPWRYGGVGAGLVLLGLGLYGYGATHPGVGGPLVLLMMLDFGWNAWHFAAQHAGVSRIYGRLTRPDQPPADAAFEKAAIRGVVLWFWLRVAVAIGTARAPELAGLAAVLDWLDFVAFAPAAVLLWREARRATRRQVGRLAYLVSVFAVYAAQIAAIRSGDPAARAALLTAGAMFHAGEYLAIVGWSARKTPRGVWRYLAPRLFVGVAVFAVAVGVTGRVVWGQASESAATGLVLVTLLVSLLHYGYDGMIWKARPAAPAR